MIEVHCTGCDELLDELEDADVLPADAKPMCGDCMLRDTSQNHPEILPNMLAVMTVGEILHDLEKYDCKAGLGDVLAKMLAVAHVDHGMNMLETFALATCSAQSLQRVKDMDGGDQTVH